MDRLRLTLNGDEGVGVDSNPQWAWNELGIRNQGGHGASNVVGPSTPVSLGEMDLARLNDWQFHSAHATAVREALAARGIEAEMRHSPESLVTHAFAGRQWTSIPSSASAPSSFGDPTAAPPPPAFVLDLCGAWGLAGLLVAALECRDGTPAARVLAVAESEEAAAALNALANENGLGPDRYVAIADSFVGAVSRGAVSARATLGSRADATSDGHDFEAARYQMACHPGLESGWGFMDRWSVVMVSSLVEGSGLLKQGGLADLEFCRRVLDDGGGDVGRAKGASSTTFLPGSLEVVCQGLQRASLLAENRVQSDRCCGVDIDPVNAFGVANFRELDLSAATPYVVVDGMDEFGGEGAIEQILGEQAVQLTVCDEGEEAFLTLPVVCYDLDLANVRAGPDGCLRRRSTRLRVQRDGTLQALAYWYRQRLGSAEGFDPVVLDTGPGPTEDDGCSSFHFRQAAVLLEKPVAVTTGQFIELSVFCNTSMGVVVQVLGIADASSAALS